MRKLVLGRYCAAGHKLSPDTLIAIKGQRHRCRVCQLGYQRAHYRRAKDGGASTLVSIAELAELREKAWKYDELSK